MSMKPKLRAAVAALTLALCLSAAPARADFWDWLFGSPAEETLAPLTVTATPRPVEVPPASLEDDGQLRVYLKSMGDPNQLDLTFAGVYAVEGDPGFRFDRNAQATLSIADGDVYMWVGGLTLDLGPSVTFTRHAAGEGEENGLYIAQSEKGTLYCGDLTVTAVGNGLRPVLKLAVEDYLYGVVAYEMSDAFPIEALKAQAVAARTYALQRKQSAGRREYDLVDTTADQVFKGYDPQYANVVAAVDATRGVAGIFENRFATCYYTASNGGQTALPSQLWGHTDGDAYLAVTDDPYDLENPRSLQSDLTFAPDCGGSPALKAMLLEALAAPMAELGYGDGEWEFESVASVTPVEPRPGADKWFDGLAFEVNMRALVSVATPQPTATDTPDAAASPAPSASPDEPQLPELTVEPRRMWVSLEAPVTVTLDVYDQIKDGLKLGLNGSDCELISVETETGPDGVPKSFKLVMRRYGHGVGMSQRGAQRMAGHYGMGWQEILAFYYPGLSFERLTWPDDALTDLSALPAGAGARRPAPTATPTPAPLPSPLPGEALAVVKLESAGSTLNVRERPSIDSRVLDLLDNGRQVLVLGEPDADGWIAVRTAEVSGFVKAEYLERK